MPNNNMTAIDSIGKQLFGANWESIASDFASPDELQTFVMREQQAMEGTEGFQMGTAIPPAHKNNATPVFIPTPTGNNAENNNEITNGAGIMETLTKPVFSIGDFPVPIWMLLVGGYVLLRMK